MVYANPTNTNPTNTNPTNTNPTIDKTAALEPRSTPSGDVSGRIPGPIAPSCATDLGAGATPESPTEFLPPLARWSVRIH